MREIKFRGQRTDTKEWVYGFYAKTVISDEINCVADCRKHDIIIDEHGTFYHVIPETVGQYTGLKDKNGIDIYEWDVIKNNFNETIGKIIFADCGYWIETNQKDEYENIKYQDLSQYDGEVLEIIEENLYE